MHVWLPILLVEGLLLAWIGRKPNGDEVSDAAIGRAVAIVALGGLFAIVDLVLFVVRNW
jgi:hypothetical protein